MKRRSAKKRRKSSASPVASGTSAPGGTPPVPPPVENNRLCLKCGLCCDGSLFGRVRIHPDEDLGRLRSAGLEICEDKKHGPVMSQPCAQYCEGRCDAYGDRPRQCRTFVCHSLARCQAGDLSMEDALRLADSLREQRRFLVALIRSHLPDFADRPLREALREIGRLLDIDGEEAKKVQRRHGALLAQAVAFRRFRDEHFGQADERE